MNGGVAGELAWLAMIERSMVRFVDDPPEVERRWDLRVTEIFKRNGDSWERVHRHADPFVNRRTVAEAARLLA